MTKLLKDKWRPARRSFSLLEMLLVLALLAVLIVLAIEGYNGVVQAAAVTTGADMLSDAFTEARASAVAQNTPV
jgi:prepilin-type N-terminal cleavage/methylation domain-containing protein